MSACLKCGSPTSGQNHRHRLRSLLLSYWRCSFPSSAAISFRRWIPGRLKSPSALPAAPALKTPKQMVAKVEELVRAHDSGRGPGVDRFRNWLDGRLVGGLHGQRRTHGCHREDPTRAEERRHSSQEYIRILRQGLAHDPRFGNLEFSFDSGGLVRGALNEGKSSPINIQLLGKNQEHPIRPRRPNQRSVRKIHGIVDARVLQRPDAPQLTIKVDRAKAA